MIVEPCCAKIQLPKVIQGGDRFFQTSGDVLMSKMIEATVPLFKGKDAALMLTCVEIDVHTLKVVSDYIDNGYLTYAVILTNRSTPNLNLVEDILYPHKNLQVIRDPMIIDGQLALASESDNLIIQGAMLWEVDLSICLYSLYHGNDLDIINTATAPLCSRLHLAQKKKTI